MADRRQPDLLGFGITLVAGASYGVGWTWVRKYAAVFVTRPDRRRSST